MNANLDPRVKVNTELMFFLVTNNCHCLIRIWEVFFLFGCYYILFSRFLFLQWVLGLFKTIAKSWVTREKKRIWMDWWGGEEYNQNISKFKYSLK